jgi:hypothetical protein
VDLGVILAGTGPCIPAGRALLGEWFETLCNNTSSGLQELCKIIARGCIGKYLPVAKINSEEAYPGRRIVVATGERWLWSELTRYAGLGI